MRSDTTSSTELLLGVRTSNQLPRDGSAETGVAMLEHQCWSTQVLAGGIPRADIPLGDSGDWRVETQLVEFRVRDSLRTPPPPRKAASGYRLGGDFS